MPTDLTVRSVSAAGPARSADRVLAPTSTAETEVLAPVIPNPKLRLDSSLGMVVLEFRGTSGEVANTIPSSRIIEAYRAAALSDTPLPVGVPERIEAAPLPAAPAAPEPTTTSGEG